MRVDLVISGMPAGVRALEHTADLGLEVTAESLEQCFALAGAGMFAVFVAPPGRDGEARVEVHVESDNREELLVAWLEDLIYRFEGEGQVPVALEVDAVTETTLTGGLVAGQGRGRITGPAIKAVTRHGLTLEPVSDGWRAVIYFDV